MFSDRQVSSPAAARQAYEALYQAGWLPSREGLFRWILRLMRPRPGSSVLDVGCGHGQLVAMITAAGARCYGVDLSWSALQEAGTGCLAAADATRLPFRTARFDQVVSIGSLEHFWNMEDGVREMVRVLRPGGRAYVLVPNAFSLTWTILNAWRSGDVSDDGQPIQRFATRRAWERLLERNGLAILATVGYERVAPCSREEWSLCLRRPREALLALLAPLVPLNLKRCFVFIGSPAAGAGQPAAGRPTHRRGRRHC